MTIALQEVEFKFPDILNVNRAWGLAPKERNIKKRSKHNLKVKTWATLPQPGAQGQHQQ